MVKSMKYKSIWLDNDLNKNIKELDKDLDLDILIIGGGLTGINTLYNLKDTTLNIALVDAMEVGHGVSGHTTGKITYLQELIYQDLTKLYSKNVAKKYYKSQITAINDIVNTIKKERIKCDLDKVDSYVFTTNKDEIKNIRIEKDILKSFGANVTEQFGNIDKLNSTYAIKVSDTYVFHPIKYLYALKNICLKSNKQIYENTKIINIEKCDNKYICKTTKYTITTKKVILACHYPFFTFPFLSPLKFGIEKSYISASICDYKKYSLITAKNPSKSIRFHKDKNEYKIFLTNSNKICNKINEENNFDNLINKSHSLNLNPEYIWKNDDIISVDKLPYIGRLENDNDNLLIATAYNTWGMTNSYLAGIILSDIILNRHNQFENLFNPLRVKSLKTFVNYIDNIACNMKGFIESKIVKNKDWYSNNVEIKNINGINVGIYKENDKVYKVNTKCPHLGCSLIFNEKEKTWDCPCHASRFDINGKCIKGPSRYDISYKE